MSLQDHIGDKWIEYYNQSSRKKIVLSDEAILARKLANARSHETLRKKRKEEIERKLLLLKQSSIDFSSFGWRHEASLLVGLSVEKIGGWLKAHDPEFYKSCFTKTAKK
jgi:hypothetical protein